MTNAEAFFQTFGIFASELWSYKPKKLEEWLREEHVPGASVWVECEKKLPPVDTDVLLLLEDGFEETQRIRVGHLTTGGNWRIGRFIEAPGYAVAWAPLPSVYKKGEDHGKGRTA